MTFSISLPNAEPRTYDRLADARKFAEKKATALGHAVEVVDTATNTVALVATNVVGRYFLPFERVETPRFPAPHFEGFYPAYTRKRIMATVYRAYDADSALNWRVYDSRTGNHLDVATTRQACILVREMRLGRVL